MPFGNTYVPPNQQNKQGKQKVYDFFIVTGYIIEAMEIGGNKRFISGKKNGVFLNGGWRQGLTPNNLSLGK